MTPGFTLNRYLGPMVPLAAAACRLLPPGKARAFQAFCVGLPRSGTHSLTSMFRKHFRSQHEALAGVTLPLLIRYKTNGLSWHSMRSFLLGRDKLLWSEMDSAHYLHLVARELAELFPKAVFIVTVREPLSWLESEINQELASPAKGWDDYASFRYGQFNAPKEKELPESSRIFGIGAYLQYWRAHVTTVLAHTPPERTLILTTDSLPRSRDRLAGFLNIRPIDIDSRASHAAQRMHKPFRLSDHWPLPYLQAQADDYCGSLWDDVCRLTAPP